MPKHVPRPVSEYGWLNVNSTTHYGEKALNCVFMMRQMRIIQTMGSLQSGYKTKTSRLFALEDRLSLLGKSSKSLVLVLRVDNKLVLSVLPLLGSTLDGLLTGNQTQGTTTGDLTGKGQGTLIGVSDSSGGNAQLDSLLRADSAASKNEVKSSGLANELGETVGTTSTGDDGKSGLGKTNLGLLTENTEVSRQGNLKTTTKSDTVDGRNGGDLLVLEQIKSVVELLEEVSSVGRGERLALLQVSTSAENAGSGGSKDQCSGVLGKVVLVCDLEELLQKLERDGVLGLGSVQGNDTDVGALGGVSRGGVGLQAVVLNGKGLDVGRVGSGVLGQEVEASVQVSGTARKNRLGQHCEGVCLWN